MSVPAERQADPSIDSAIAGGALVETVGSCWSFAKLRSELGNVGRQTLHKRAQQGSILALPTSDGATVYPVFQFVRHEGEVKVLPGLRVMLKILRDQDPWTVAVALRTEAPELHGATPVEWVRQGGSDSDLLELAESLKREWADHQSSSE